MQAITIYFGFIQLVQCQESSLWLFQSVYVVTTNGGQEQFHGERAIHIDSTLAPLKDF